MSHPDIVIEAIAHGVAAQCGVEPGRLAYLKAYRSAYESAAANPYEASLRAYLSDLDSEIAIQTPPEGKFFGRHGQLVGWLRRR